MILWFMVLIIFSFGMNRWLKILLVVTIIYLLWKPDDKENYAATDMFYNAWDDDYKLYLYNPDSDRVTGIDKCRKRCKGPCIRRGYSNDAICIPYYEGQEEQIDAWKEAVKDEYARPWCDE